MAYAGINVQFGRYMCAGQREVELWETLRDIRPVVASACQEGGWGLGGDARILRNRWVKKRLEVGLCT